jgi:hypothetical protein
MHEALVDTIDIAKTNGFDLKKCYIAEAYVHASSHGLSRRFVEKYLRGRGRYGATPHVKTARLEILIQQRENGGFKKRESGDPLEWLRIRLRERKKGVVVGAEDLWTERRKSRPAKQVYLI